jgi:hypothetical protein
MAGTTDRNISPTNDLISASPSSKFSGLAPWDKPRDIKLDITDKLTAPKRSPQSNNLPAPNTTPPLMKFHYLHHIARGNVIVIPQPIVG